MINSNSSSNCLRIGLLLTVVVTTFIVMLGSKASQAQSTEYVVFSIKGTIGGLSLGQVLKEGDIIELPAEVEVNLLSKEGEFTRLEGPLKAVVINESKDQTGEAALAKLAQLFFDEEKFVPTIGATRSLDGNTDISTLLVNHRALTPWSPVLSQLDNYCLNTDRPVLSRTSADSELTIVLTTGKSKTQSITWAAASQFLPLTDYLDPGHTYITASVSDRVEPITIHILDIGQTSVMEQAVWMAERKCRNQAIQLLARGEQ